jgi:hypothetical protein
MARWESGGVRQPNSTAGALPGFVRGLRELKNFHVTSKMLDQLQKGMIQTIPCAQDPFSYGVTCSASNKETVIISASVLFLFPPNPTSTPHQSHLPFTHAFKEPGITIARTPLTTPHGCHAQSQPSDHAQATHRKMFSYSERRSLAVSVISPRLSHSPSRPRCRTKKTLSAQ